MKRRPALSIARSWFSRGWILYVIVVVAVFLFVDIKRMASHAKPATLSRLRPNYRHIGALADGSEAGNRKSLEDQRVYLENVNTIVGERPDTDALLGYVNFWLGEKARAEDFWNRSLKLNPTYFWTYYNLGVMAYSTGDTDKARKLLQYAVSLNPELSMKFLLTSRIFLPLMEESIYTPQKFMDRLYSGYADAYKILVTIVFADHDFKQALSLSQAGLKISTTDTDRVFFLYYVGASALRSGVVPVAVKALEECLKLDADHPEALADMASILKEAGRQNMALALLERAKNVQKKSVSRLLKPEEFRVKIF